MANFYDIAYYTALGIGSPFWLIKSSARKKVLSAFGQRMGKVSMRPDNNPAVMIHAVSLGEVNATQALIKVLKEARPDVRLILSTTTETGFTQANKLYPFGSGVTVIRYPLDFSGAINSVLSQLRPSVVVLMELELWPNFMKQCEARKIPVILANGRITAPSYRKYRIGSPIARTMFSRLAVACAQDETYAQRFRKLGASDVRVLGSMKFDNAQLVDRVPGSLELADEVGLRPGVDRVWVCGSTGPGEEEIILREFRLLLAKDGWQNLRLVIVPRHPQRFDEVARLIEESKFHCTRRSAHDKIFIDRAIPPVVLGDTMGELKKFYSLADVIFVGRSLVDLGPKQHGSDMIEAAALGRPVIVGPFTGNFSVAMDRLREAGAIVEVTDGPTLQQAVTHLLNVREEARKMAQSARVVIDKEQGSTERHVRVILGYLPTAAKQQS